MANIDDLNLITNPFFTNDLSDWNVSNPTGGFGPRISGGRVSFNAGNEPIFGDSIDQAFATTIGNTYSVTLDLIEDNGGKADHTFQIDILDATGAVIETRTVTVTDESVNQIGFTFVATTTAATLKITNTFSTNSASTDGKVDNVRVIDVTGDDTLDGTDEADTLLGGPGADTFDGQDGNDRIAGGAGNDVFEIGAGKDVIFGGAGDDQFLLRGASEGVLFGGADTDTLVLQGLKQHDLTGFSIDGIEVLHVIASGSGVEVRLTLEQLRGFDSIVTDIDSVVGLNLIVLGDGAEEVDLSSIDVAFDPDVVSLVFESGDNAETIIGAPSFGLIKAGGGDDTVFGGGSEHIFGDAGNDTFVVADDGGTTSVDGGIEQLFGGEDNTLDLSGFTSGIKIPVNPDVDPGVADSGNGTRVIFEEIGFLIGTHFDDDVAMVDLFDITLGGGDDILRTSFSTNAAQRFDGGAGNDTLDLSELAEAVNLDLATGSFNGTKGAFDFENVIGSQENDSIAGTVGANSIDGQDGDDTLIGGAGNDTLNGGDDVDLVDAGDGDDIVINADGLQFETLDGGAGIDTIDMSGLSLGGVTFVDLAAGLARFDRSPNTETILNFENFIGHIGREDVTGTSGANMIATGGGNDTLRGAGGNDQLFGGDGEDTAVFEGTLTEFRFANDADGYAITRGGETALVVGVESFAFDDLTLTATEVQEIIDTTIGGIPGNVPTSGDDTLIGTDLADTVATLGGNDVLRGLAGDDALAGNGGDDSLFGNSGADHLSGGTGVDHLFGGTKTDKLVGDAGNDHLYGGSGADMLLGAGGADMIEGGKGADHAFGGGGADHISGSSGKDLLRGGAGFDQLFGGGGRDELFGGAGQDQLMGGTGSDRLKGGQGADTFIFRRNDGDDRISDFEAGTDLIRIVSGARDFDALEMRQAGSDVIVGLGGTTIRLEGMEISDLDVDDFAFGPVPALGGDLLA